ncbi:MAG: chemotaxis protein CheB [Clostridia bacterium]|jgi:two-component system chemotaxis response regulator CheB|nr:chemotaxis protein CheB [Clostridia bacterium]
MTTKVFVDKILLIGTSTGGPKALQEVLPLLPENFPAPILIVQHMPPGFTKSLANRLNSLAAVLVKEAEDGEVLQKGVAYIAPGDFHLTIAKHHNNYLAVKLTKDPVVNGHRPSVNVMMESVCYNYNGKIIGVIMTGMGSDGTEGMKLIKGKNGITIAEAESTCIVFGMPKAAIQANCIDLTVPLHDIADIITKSMRD